MNITDEEERRIIDALHEYDDVPRDLTPKLWEEPILEQRHNLLSKIAKKSSWNHVNATQGLRKIAQKRTKDNINGVSSLNNVRR